jgi:hypothetical protein
MKPSGALTLLGALGCESLGRGLHPTYSFLGSQGEAGSAIGSKDLRHNGLADSTPISAARGDRLNHPPGPPGSPMVPIREAPGLCLDNR